MALSLSHFTVICALLVSSLRTAVAKTITYDFNITWVYANPDGQFVRPTIGINNQWPLPVMTGSVGDQIIVNVDNQLGNQTTTLHFHGLYMNGTTHMDGPLQVSQCGIAPGSQFTYNFTVSCIVCNTKIRWLTRASLINQVLTGTIRMQRDNTQVSQATIF